MNIVKNLFINFKNSILFFLPSIVGLFLNLYTTPIFSRNLSHYDFSLLGYFASIQAFVLPVLNLSLFPYYMKGYSKRDKSENAAVMNSLILFLGIANIFTILIFTVIAAVFFSATNVSFPLSPYIFLSLFASYFLIFISAATMNYKMTKQGWKYAFVGSSHSLLSILLGLLFVVVMELGAMGRMSGTLLSQGLVGSICVWIIYDKTVKWKFQYVKEALKLGYPLILLALLQFPILHIDRIFLEKLDDTVNFALYNIGVSVAGYMFVMGSSIFQAFEPDFYLYINDRNWKKVMLLAAVVFLTISGINIIFNLTSEWILGILTSDLYTEAYKYANVFVWSNLLLLVTYFLNIFFIIKSRTKSLLLREIILAFIGLPAFYFAIHFWHFWGGAFTKVFMNSLNILILMILLNNFKKSMNSQPEN